MKKKSIFDEMEQFFAKYIPPLSGEKLLAFKTKLKKAKDKLGLKKFLSEFCIESAIFQSNDQEREDGIKFSYYSECLERIIISTSIYQKDKLIGSIGSGYGLFEIFAAKKLFPQSRFVCLDYSANCCAKSKKVATEENLTNIDFVIGDALNLPFKDHQFNIIWSFGALSCDKKLDTGFRGGVAKITKPDGAVILG